MPARVVLDKCPPGASEVERATELIASGLQGPGLAPPLSDNAELLDAVEALAPGGVGGQPAGRPGAIWSAP